jgi:hypothetical protein
MTLWADIPAPKVAETFTAIIVLSKEDPQPTDSMMLSGLVFGLPSEFTRLHSCDDPTTL